MVTPTEKSMQPESHQQGGRATESPVIPMDTAEQVRNSSDLDDDFHRPKVGEVDPGLLAYYAGHWVSWSPDGTSIIAHAENTTALTKLVIEAGVNPSECVFEQIEEGPLI